MKPRELSCSARRSLLAPLIVAGSVLAGQAATRADILYVSNPGNNSIEKFDSVTGADIGTFAHAGLSFTRGIAFDRVGNLYAANYDGYSASWIEKFTPAGVGSVFATSGVSDPWGLAVDAAGNLLVANSYNIEKFSPGGLDLGSFSSVGVNFPKGLAFDPAGNLYVANMYRIEKFSPSGADLGSLDGDSYYYYYPNCLAFDRAGNLYATTAANTILRYNADGVASVFITGLNGPMGLAFDCEGYLYVANMFENTIEKFSPSGAEVATFTGPGLKSPAFIAFGVPEPSTFALLALSSPVLIVYRWLRPRTGSEHSRSNLR